MFQSCIGKIPFSTFLRKLRAKVKEKDAADWQYLSVIVGEEIRHKARCSESNELLLNSENPDRALLRGSYDSRIQVFSCIVLFMEVLCWYFARILETLAP